MITKYGFDVYVSVVAICIGLGIVSYVWLDSGIFRYTVLGFAVLLLVFATNFFRDPDRITPKIDNGIFAPADGKVIIVKPVQQSEYLGGDAIQISIFMSPLNVHVNRNPISGVVEHLRYVKGEYFAAFEDKASEKNEQMVIGLKNPQGKVLFKQIAGFVARRIVCTLHVGDSVTAGERFGMIKFGSRVDVFVPPTAKVHVKVGDATTAGETVVAEFAN